MPLWRLLPIDRTSDHWRASTYQGEVIVRAASEAEARSTATATFFLAYARIPGEPGEFGGPGGRGRKGPPGSVFGLRVLDTLWVNPYSIPSALARFSEE